MTWKEAASLVGMPLLAVIVLAPALWWFTERVADQLEASERSHLKSQAEQLALTLSEDSRLLVSGLSDWEGVFKSKALQQVVQLDGRLNEWEGSVPRSYSLDHIQQAHESFSVDSLGYDLRIANDQVYLYLHYQVRDDVVVYRSPGQLSVHRNDHIQIAMIDVDGVFHRYAISAIQPGETSAVEVSDTGRALRAIDGIAGYWLATENGYQVELRIARQLLSKGFGTVVADVDDPATRKIRYLVGPSTLDQVDALARIEFSPSELQLLIDQMRLQVEVRRNDESVVASNWVQSEDAMHEVRTEILGLGARHGFVVLRDTKAGYRDQARIFAIEGYLLLVLIVFVATLFSARKVRGSASRHNQLEQQSIRLTQHNEYLEKMASRLNHEVRTPVSVVKSSIEHLQAMAVPEETAVYIQRASEGVNRLTMILNRMSEARRLEESLVTEDVIRFDLAQLVSGCVAGYELAYPDSNFFLTVEEDELPVTGIPDMFVQMLDKVIDNAVEFSTNGEIKIRLSLVKDRAVLRVMNEGPELPEQDADLFDSMVSVRASGPGMHLGLGLYVARVIAEFHGAMVSLSNREDTKGVTATIEIPILRITSRLR